MQAELTVGELALWKRLDNLQHQLDQLEDLVRGKWATEAECDAGAGDERHGGIDGRVYDHEHRLYCLEQGAGKVVEGLAHVVKGLEPKR